MEIGEIRQQIDNIDADLVRLLETRMTLVSQILAQKKITSKAVYDPAREQEVLRKIADLVSNSDFQESIVNSFADIMKNSREFQNKKIGSN